jgi:uridine phosphorylase
MVASEGSAYICRNPDAFASCYDSTEAATTSSSDSEVEEVAYRLSKVAPADAELSQLVLARLGENVGAEKLRTGTNVTAESFYSSQGRNDPVFDDRNQNIHDMLLKELPTARSLEMESFWLLHLAKCSKIPIKATAAAIVLANRPTGNVMDGPALDEMEKNGGLAMLQALAQVSL